MPNLFAHLFWIREFRNPDFFAYFCRIYRVWNSPCNTKTPRRRPAPGSCGPTTARSAPRSSCPWARPRPSRASSTATCATKPECGLFYLIANKIVFYLVINKEMFNFGSGGKLLPALFREFSELSEQGSTENPEINPL